VKAVGKQHIKNESSREATARKMKAKRKQQLKSKSNNGRSFLIMKAIG